MNKPMTESELNDAYKRAGIVPADSTAAPENKKTALKEEPIFGKTQLLLEEIRETERQILEELEKDNALKYSYRLIGINPRG